MKGGAPRSKFLRLITSPFRVLAKAGDLYVRSLTRCANGGNYTSASAYPSTASYPPLPKSFSVSSSFSNDSEDFRELVRAASAKSFTNRVEIDSYAKKTSPKVSVRPKTQKVPRSCSVGMARIDEEETSEVGEDSVKTKRSWMYPRSRSVAVTSKQGSVG